MLVINNRVFLPQQRSRSTSEEKANDIKLTHRRKSIDLNVTGIQNFNDILDNCRTLGDAIHEPEQFIEKDHSMDFLCVICQCICSTPMDIGCKNGHIYCKQCLNSFFETRSNAQCPQCSDNVSRYGTRINHFALRLLLKLKILCPFSIEMCLDQNETKQYQCEWIGCYSDIIDHLKNKCKYGTFINNTSIKAIRAKYGQNDHDDTIKSRDTSNKDIWKISRAEITSYRVYWEQICDKDDNVANHVDKHTLKQFLHNLTDNELNKLWFVVGDNGDSLMTENQFYAAIHIARLHKNEYKSQCNLHTLYSLPPSLSANRINKARSASDVAKIKGGCVHDEKKKDEINLESIIGTMHQLKLMAGIKKHRKKRKHSKQQSWNITKEDIDGYRRWFIKADINKDGFIDGDEGRTFFMKSELSAAVLGKIWLSIDHERNGKLTEAQFYAFFHIVMTIKKGSGKLPDEFVLPACLEPQNILNIMNVQSNDNVDDSDWINKVFLKNITSTNTYVSPSDILDSLTSTFNNNEVSAHNRESSIDSVHDWADFKFEF